MWETEEVVNWLIGFSSKLLGIHESLSSEAVRTTSILRRDLAQLSYLAKVSKMSSSSATETLATRVLESDFGKTKVRFGTSQVLKERICSIQIYLGFLKGFQRAYRWRHKFKTTTRLIFLRSHLSFKSFLSSQRRSVPVGPQLHGTM